MKADEILEKTTNSNGALITEYIGKDGYVWVMITKAMKEYAVQEVNKEKESIREMLIGEDFENLAERI